MTKHMAKYATNYMAKHMINHISMHVTKHLAKYIRVNNQFPQSLTNPFQASQSEIKDLEFHSRSKIGNLLSNKNLKNKSKFV